MRTAYSWKVLISHFPAPVINSQNKKAMELTFLGTGTSQGVPMIEWDCVGLDLNNPKNWRGRSCAHLYIDETHIQIDAAPEFRLACIREKIPAVDYFFLTHEHSDHLLGIEDLRRYCSINGGNAIPVYSTQSGIERVKTVFDYGIREHSEDGYIALKSIVMPKKLQLPKGTVVESVILPHGKKISTLGLVFTEKTSGKKIAYYTDCNRVPENAIELAKNADILVIDGLRPNPHPTHLSVPEAVEVAQKINAGQTYLIHMTWQIDHETWSKKLPAGIALAYDGLRVKAG